MCIRDRISNVRISKDEQINNKADEQIANTILSVLRKLQNLVVSWFIGHLISKNQYCDIVSHSFLFN